MSAGSASGGGAWSRRGEFAEGGEEGGDADRDALRLGGVGWVAGGVGGAEEDAEGVGLVRDEGAGVLGDVLEVELGEGPEGVDEAAALLHGGELRGGAGGGEEDVRAAVQARLGFLRGEVGAQALDRLGVGVMKYTASRLLCGSRPCARFSTRDTPAPVESLIPHDEDTTRTVTGSKDEHLPLPAALRETPCRACRRGCAGA